VYRTLLLLNITRSADTHRPLRLADVYSLSDMFPLFIHKTTTHRPAVYDVLNVFFFFYSGTCPPKFFHSRPRWFCVGPEPQGGSSLQFSRKEPNTIPRNTSPFCPPIAEALATSSHAWLCPPSFPDNRPLSLPRFQGLEPVTGIFSLWFMYTGPASDPPIFFIGDLPLLSWPPLGNPFPSQLSMGLTFPERSFPCLLDPLVLSSFFLSFPSPPSSRRGRPLFQYRRRGGHPSPSL